MVRINQTIPLLLAKHSQKGAWLLPSPNRILFTLAIFKHICWWSLEFTVNLSLATCNPHVFKMGYCGDGKDSFCSVHWLGATCHDVSCGSHLLPSKSAKGNKLLKVRSFLSFLLISVLELVRRRWEASVSHQQFPQSSSPSLEVLFLVNSYKSGPPWPILWEEAPGWNFVIKARFFSGGRVEEATPVAPPVLVSSWSA